MINPPTRLVVEVAAVCNLKCPQCWTGLRWSNRQAHLMQMDLFNKVMDEAKGFIRHTYLHNWGEPTLNPHLPEMIRRTQQFSTIDLATHGLNMTDELADIIAECDTVSVSIDGATQEVYEKYRIGGQLDVAMNGLKMLADRRKGKQTNWTYVVFKENEHEIPKAQAIAEELGVNIGFKPSLFWDRTAMDRSMPSDEKYRRYSRVNGQWVLKADKSKCREFWETIYVLPTGDVVTCCYDGGAKFIVGNVWQKPMLDIWNDEPYMDMRRKHLGGVLNPMCIEFCNMPS